MERAKVKPKSRTWLDTFRGQGKELQKQQISMFGI